MRSSSAASLTRPRPLALHERWGSVEYERWAAEMRSQLSGIMHHARQGTRPPCLSQMGKDIGSGQNCFARTLVRFTCGAQDIGIPTDHITNPIENHLAMLRAREPGQQARSVDDLLALETQIESEINPLQWEFARDTRNGFLRRHLIATLRRAIANLQALLSSLEKEEADDIRRSNLS